MHLVTGATGVIGRTLVEPLLAEGAGIRGRPARTFAARVADHIGAWS